MEEELHKKPYNKNVIIAGLGIAVLAVLGIVLSLKGPEIDSTNLAFGVDARRAVDVFERSNPSNPVVTFYTTNGDISIELYMDQTPITAANFLELAQSEFYTETKFHRVIDNFMIQGGDPNSKGDNTELYGRGGPGYTIEDEFVPGLSNLRGTISMANIGQPNTGGSQFFINFTNNVGLDFDKEPFTSKHPVFGHVVMGMEVVDSIARVETNSRDLPLVPVVIENVVITPGIIAASVEETPPEAEVQAIEEEKEEKNEEIQGILKNEHSDGNVSYDPTYPIQFSIPTLISL